MLLETVDDQAVSMQQSAATCGLFTACSHSPDLVTGGQALVVAGCACAIYGDKQM